MSADDDTTGDGDESNTPPVPPTEIDVIDQDETGRGSRVLSRERQYSGCWKCGGDMYLVERETGRVEVAIWDPEVYDSDEFDLSAQWPEVETVERCDRCGLHRRIA